MLNERRRPDGASLTRSAPSPSKRVCCRALTARPVHTRRDAGRWSPSPLETKDDEQRIELSRARRNRPPSGFMLHYNFPAVQRLVEVGFMRGAGRRKLATAALAERSMIRVLPDEAKFPF